MAGNDSFTNAPDVQLEGGTYEILRERLTQHGTALKERLDTLNHARKEVFGTIDLQLLGTDRITTTNNCIPADIVALHNTLLVGYNVHLGLKSETALSDVFAVYAFDPEQNTFQARTLDLLADAQFAEDFQNLYRYYKQTVFAKFAVIGPHLFMVFRVGKSATDIKTFKWLIQDETLSYIDNRSDHEFKYPPQHEFAWQRVTRDMHRQGAHPHISIADRVFVETVGGDLTIKIEDNTDDGSGIYTEDVEHQDQTLDDAQIHYAIVGNSVLLKIRPYQERADRYIVYNGKIQEARRIDAIRDACVLLPGDHGLLFSNGYYLDTGTYKTFESATLANMRFEKRITAPNGEDFLYVFYNPETGNYILLSYNLIDQHVETPIVCKGYSIFEDGRLLYFRTTDEPAKHHALQVWQTPYVSANYSPPIEADSLLYKIGNKDLVRGMAEATEVYALIQREDAYANLYLDLVKKTNDLLDTYYWLDHTEVSNIAAVIRSIKEAASGAVEAFEKVVRIRKTTQQRTQAVAAEAEDVLASVRRHAFRSVDQYVQALADLRRLRGTVISLRDLRYVHTTVIDDLESQVTEQTERLSEQCTTFLLEPDALAPYHERVDALSSSIEQISKVVDAQSLTQDLDAAGHELDLLIEIVSNLKITDATQTTQIIDAISAIYARLNQYKAQLKQRTQELGETESAAAFSAQTKLLSQSVINYLDVADTPAKCDEYLTKVMVQISELEGRFAEFETFSTQLAEKREEIYAAFESQRVRLVEAHNKRTNALFRTAERILDGIRTRVKRFDTLDAIHGYFAADLMVGKIRNLVQKLTDLADPVKADNIKSQLQTIREEAVRDLKDRQDLFVDGRNQIQFGEHVFSVQTQPFELTTVLRDDHLYVHLTGTEFFEPLDDPAFQTTRAFWTQEVLSENPEVYRGAYLAYVILRAAEAGTSTSVETLHHVDDATLLTHVQAFMGPRYDEAYLKGVHDHDAAKLLRALLQIRQEANLLRYSPTTRACALLYWEHFADGEQKNQQAARLRSLRTVFQLFPSGQNHYDPIQDLQAAIAAFAAETGLFDPDVIPEAGAYLFHELTQDDLTAVSTEALNLTESFQMHLHEHQFDRAYQEAVTRLQDDPVGRFDLIRTWLGAFIQETQPKALGAYVDEAALLLFSPTLTPTQVTALSTSHTLTGLLGTHPQIQQGTYHLEYSQFMQTLKRFATTTVPAYRAYVSQKHNLLTTYRKRLRLEAFKPRVLTSFVRNQLIDHVFLPLIGDNLAKQIGTAGDTSSSARMGLLLLISPPGYGKTTLMEYVASRLGLIFVKVNGPSIGHNVTSLDPDEAPNAAAREEIQKLNLALVMGDNVMLYLDDIQHCHPEFLQKFISLCDAQRRIEGVYRGKSQTYDLRGKKVAVVMAGNPYTESGERFRIPDMLANRADTYNLGDIIGGRADSFKLSYLENAMTANAALKPLATRNPQDVYAFLRFAQTDSREALEVEGTYTPEEISEIVAILKKLMVVRDTILRVNQAYIASAAQADAYRTEPPFLLQGSYRNMNRLAEKVVPIMNDAELDRLLLSHYEQEAQLLTGSAEANLLKFKQLQGILTEAETNRWVAIKKTFRKNQAFHGLDAGDQMVQVLAQLSALTEGLSGIKEVLASAVTQKQNSNSSYRINEIIDPDENA